MVDRRDFIKLAAASVIVPSAVAESEKQQEYLKTLDVSFDSSFPVEVIFMEEADSKSLKIGTIIGPVAKKDFPVATELANHIQNVLLSHNECHISKKDDDNSLYPEAIPETEQMIISNPLAKSVSIASSKETSLDDCKKNLEVMIQNDGVVAAYLKKISNDDRQNNYWLKTV